MNILGERSRVQRAFFLLAGLCLCSGLYSAKGVAQSYFTYRVNAGGDEFTAMDGRVFAEDQEYTIGSFGYSGGNTNFYPTDIENTEDDSLYQSIRHRPLGFDYKFDTLPVDTYKVTIHWMEPNFETGGSRLIDVKAEGTTVLNNFDIAAVAGGRFKAHDEVIFVEVTDGQLILEFVPVLGTPFVCGVSVEGVSPYAPRFFVDRAGEAGLVLNHLPIVCGPKMGTGSAWADYDNDGDVDLYVTEEFGLSHLYRNDGDLTGDGIPDFTDVGEESGAALAFVQSMGAVFIDYDNDGDQDLFVSNWGGNSLLQNMLMELGTPNFDDVTGTAGIGNYGRTITGSWGDFDRDGYLDLYIAKHRYCTGNDQNQDFLFRNNGDGTFADVTDWLCEGSAPCPQVLGLGFTAGWFDYDNDSDPDLYLINDNIGGVYYPNVLWRNDGPDTSGGWVFTDVSVESGTGFSENGMGLGVGDYDNDGWLDAAFSNIGPNFLLHNEGDGTFVNVAAAAGVERSVLPGNMASVTWGTVFFDYNNDQFLDLFFAAGPISTPTLYQPDAFFVNNQDGTFTDISEAAGLNDPRMARCSSIADFDGDGFMDLFVGRYGMPPSLYRNEAFDLGNTFQWLTITVEGTTSNRDGIGTRLTLVTPDGVSQTREITSGPTYGGGDQRIALFGMRDNVEGTLTVRWPTGIEQVVGTVASGQSIHVIEGEDGPGPWLTTIPDQRINQTQGAFPPILLDQYVTHPSQPDSLIAWSVSGEDYILVNIDSGRIAITTRIDSSWIGADTISFMATDTAGVSFSTEVIFVSALEYRMNIGGDSVTSTDGKFFQEDVEYTGGGFGVAGGTSRVFSVPISDTEDDYLYQSVRTGQSGFALTLDTIPNGIYEITLHFMEPLRKMSGNRILDVVAEDVVVLNDFDVFAKAGGLFTATSELVTATVADSQLNISVLPSNGRSILLCAIEIVFAGSPAAELGRNGVVASSALTAELPSEFMLHQNYPNPFNPSTTIRFALAAPGAIQLTIYDMLGRQVATIVDHESPAGRYSTVWNGTDHAGRPVSSGVYFYRLTTPEGVALKRMILAK